MDHVFIVYPSLIDPASRGSRRNITAHRISHHVWSPEKRRSSRYFRDPLSGMHVGTRMSPPLNECGIRRFESFFCASVSFCEGKHGHFLSLATRHFLFFVATRHLLFFLQKNKKWTSEACEKKI